MIGQYLSNRNKIATVVILPKILELIKAYVSTDPKKTIKPIKFEDSSPLQPLARHPTPREPSLSL